MTCRELIEFLMDYLDGALPDAESRSFDEHLRECDGCAAYVASYRTTVELGCQVCSDLEGAVPADVPEDLVTAILDARRAV